MSNIRKLFTNKGSTASYALLTAVFTVVPEDCFLMWKSCDKWKDSTNALINRLIACVAIFIIANIIYTIWRKNRKEVQVTGCRDEGQSVLAAVTRTLRHHMQRQ